MKKSICIVVERSEDGFDKNVYNILGYISHQFHKEFIITATCIGGCSEKESELFYRYGITQIIVLDTPGYISDETGKKDLGDFVGTILPQFEFSLIVFMSTDNGKMLASRLAIRYSSGLVAECVSINKGKEDAFVFQRAALSGSVIAEIVCKDSDIQMCTIKNVTSPMMPAEKSGKCEIKRFVQPFTGNEHFKIEEIVNLEADQVADLTSADIIIGLGCGIKNKTLIGKVEQIAEQLSIALGYTRGFVELHEDNRQRQIGQSGFLVSPKLYIAFGVSGATQHIVGVNNAQCIISVNIDEKAPIHEHSDYIIVEDAESVIGQIYEIMQNN